MSISYSMGNLSRYEKAIASYDEALKIKPNDANTFYNKSYLYALQSNVEQAIKNLQQGINSSPEYREMPKTDSGFDGIRKNDHFKTLIQRES